VVLVPTCETSLRREVTAVTLLASFVWVCPCASILWSAMTGIDSVVWQEGPALGEGSEQKVQHRSGVSRLGAGRKKTNSETN